MLTSRAALDPRTDPSRRSSADGSLRVSVSTSGAAGAPKGAPSAEDVAPERARRSAPRTHYLLYVRVPNVVPRRPPPAAAQRLPAGSALSPVRSSLTTVSRPSPAVPSRVADAGSLPGPRRLRTISCTFESHNSLTSVNGGTKSRGLRRQPPTAAPAPHYLLYVRVSQQSHVSRRRYQVAWLTPAASQGRASSALSPVRSSLRTVSRWRYQVARLTPASVQGSRSAVLPGRLASPESCPPIWPRRRFECFQRRA